MVDPIFLNGLSEENPWWSDRFKPELEGFHRGDFYELRKYVDEDSSEPRILVLIGPRRVGKTFLLTQLISYLLVNKKIPSQNILFASLDRNYLQFISGGVTGLLEYYQTNVLKHRLSSNSDKVYLFLDEVQLDPNWVTLLKQYSDQGKNVTCVVTGSSSTALYKHSRESGAGRFKQRFMLPMKFRDVLRFFNQENNQIITEISVSLRNSFVEAIVQKNSQIYFTELQKAQQRLLTAGVPIERALNEYLYKGGYPELYSSPRWDVVFQKYQQDVFDAIINKDLGLVYGIKHPIQVRRLFTYILSTTAEQIGRETLAEVVHMPGRKTSRLKYVDTYLGYLSDAMLIRVSSKYLNSPGRPSTKEKKYYASDVGLRNIVLGLQQTSLTEHDIGNLTETIVFDHMLRLESYIEGSMRKEGLYWKAKKSDVDMVLDLRQTKNRVVPIEVKAGLCGAQDRAKVRKCVSGAPAPFGLVVCKNQLEADEKILAVPLALFLLTA